MCIMFCTSHPDSTREHFVGTYHCAHLGCPGTIEAHQKFLLEDDASECSPCLMKDKVKVDPDIVPVEHYPPVEDIEIEYVGLAGYRKVVKREKKSQEQEKEQEKDQEKANSPTQEHEALENEESTDLADWRSAQDFSDVDSVTSYWRLDERPTTTNDVPAECLKSPSPLKGSATPFSPQDTPEKVTPNTHKHRELVNEQLAKLPFYTAQPPPPPPPHQEPSFGIMRPFTHAFAPAPVWPYLPHNPQPLQPPPHATRPFHGQSMINAIPRRDYMLWHSTAVVDQVRTKKARARRKIAHDEFFFMSPWRNARRRRAGLFVA